MGSWQMGGFPCPSLADRLRSAHQGILTCAGLIESKPLLAFGRNQGLTLAGCGELCGGFVGSQAVSKVLEALYRYSSMSKRLVLHFPNGEMSLVWTSGTDDQIEAFREGHPKDEAHKHVMSKRRTADCSFWYDSDANMGRATYGPGVAAYASVLWCPTRRQIS